MSAAKPKKDVASSLSNLSLGNTKTTKTKSKKNVVVDSWEDEDLSSGSDEENGGGDSKKNTSLPSAPPPTPITPSYNSQTDTTFVPDFSSGNYVPMSPGLTEARRPEKTDAVARRMIAGALGMKAPKQTEEQKAYDRAIKEQARRKKEEERAAERKRQEEVEKAKAAMWGD